MTRAAAAVAFVALAGCQAVAGLGDFTPDDSSSSGPGGDGGGGSSSADGGGSPATASTSTAATSTASTGSTSTSSTGGPGCGPDHLVISEVRTRGPTDGNQDFVEILNPTQAAILLDAAFRIEARGEETASYGERWTGDGTLSIGPGERVLLANAFEPNPLGDATADAPFGSGIPDGASVVLYQDDVVLDAVCFLCGAPALDAGYLCEGAPLIRPEGCDADGDRSVQRRTQGGVEGCADTDDNAADLEDRAPSTPMGLGG